jgi:hypothetical protein
MKLLLKWDLGNKQVLFVFIIGSRSDNKSGRKIAATESQNNVRSLIKNIENKFGRAFDKTVETSSHVKPFLKSKQHSFKISNSSQKETFAIRERIKNDCETNNSIPNAPSPLSRSLKINEPILDSTPSLPEDEYSECIVRRKNPEIKTENAKNDAKSLSLLLNNDGNLPRLSIQSLADTQKILVSTDIISINSILTLNPKD